MDFEDRFNCGLLEIADQLANGKISSVELARYSINQIEKFDETLNAYKIWDEIKILETAKKADEARSKNESCFAMQGIPVSVKDLYGLSGYPIFAGSPKELPPKWQSSGPVVKTLAQQLAMFTGKTHTVEFAYGGLGVNKHWGTPRNPWDAKNHRVPGGSSAGAGVSLCEGSAFVALGTDTSGSVRIPASYTANVGLKTTTGLWSTAGIVPLSPTLDTAGILTRTVRDAIFAFLAIQQTLTYPEICKQLQIFEDQINDGDIRVGLNSGILWTDTEKSIADTCIKALNILENEKCPIIPIDFPEANIAIEMRNRGGPISVEITEFLQSELPQWFETLDPIIRERIRIGDDISAIEYLNRLRLIRNARTAVKKRFTEVDVIASPTVTISPPLMTEVKSTKAYMSKNMLALQNTSVGSFLDLCSITVPVGFDTLDMPVGLQLMAPPHKEKLLLKIGRRVENAVQHHRLMLQGPYKNDNGIFPTPPLISDQS